MSIEIKNIIGNCGDIYEKETGFLILSQYGFTSKPTNSDDAEGIEISKILKLKEAGFDCEEIIKICKEIKPS